MSRAERILAARLLRMASETFSNHGCNDTPDELFDGISPTEQVVMAEAYNRWNDPKGVEEPTLVTHIGDASWMDFLAHRMEQA